MDRNLNAFLAVARRGSATAAAAQLNIAQSAVTKRIVTLEEQMGTPLFVRERRGMRPTRAGELFMARAVKIEQEYLDGIDEVSAIASAGLTELTIGAGPVFHLKWVSGLSVALTERFPSLKLNLLTLNQENPSLRLMSGEMDVYLGIIPEEDLNDTIEVRHVSTVEHGIVMRSKDRDPGEDSVDPDRLAGYKWVSFVDDPITERSIEQYTLPGGADGTLIDIRTTSFATGVQLVKSGSFVMSAPLQLGDTVKRDGLVILPLRGGMPKREAGIHVRKSMLGYGAIKTVINYFEPARLGQRIKRNGRKN